MMSQQIQRRFERAPYAGTVAVWKDRQPHLVRARDLSAGGVFLDVEEAFHEGSLLTLRLGLPGENGFTVLARAVRNCLGGAQLPQRGVAFEFIDIMPRDRSRVDRYVSRFISMQAAV